MAVLKSRKRYVFGGSMVIDVEGHPHRFKRGDDLPPAVRDRMTDRELAVHLESGWLIDPSAPKPAPPAPAPPRLPTPLEILQNVEPRATLEDNRVVGVPGCEISLLQRSPRDADFKRVVEPSRGIQAIVHPVGDAWAVTVDLGRLAETVGRAEADALMFTRPFAAYPGVATTQYVGSVAGGVLIAPSNAGRLALTVQALTDGLRIAPFGSVNGSTLPFAPSGIVLSVPLHAGAVYANPLTGATIAVAIWESQS